ncbi:hypothetical protein CPIN17262_0493 [Campylobacter pinnipediorum subsp. pinnipediorum]|uniref:hypothetical protein n=1 Tax=Campylobacter pinnipediorum TaxID=1965231 RepID=UPI000994D87B|nr:hypothetical protein [Campylobacter pinnipediorum]AQW84194.1 hypothetical protein CPIN17262_0493 [Campylobacter pinnipediorum subsp. pinnipediorum]
MQINKEDIAKFSDKAKGVFDGLSTITSVFFPQITAPVTAVSKVFSKISELDDTEAENIAGLSATAFKLDEMIKQVEKGEKIDIKHLKELSENIKSIDSSLDKFYKVIS